MKPFRLKNKNVSLKVSNGTFWERIADMITINNEPKAYMPVFLGTTQHSLRLSLEMLINAYHGRYETE